MPTLSTDPRWLHDDYLIDFQWKKIIFYDMKISSGEASAIEAMLQWNNYFVGEQTEKVIFSSHINIYHTLWNTFVLEFDDKEKRDETIKSLKSHFKPTKYFSEVMENGRQVPSFQGYFDHKWSSYIIVYGRNKLTEEKNPQKGIYQWVIVDPLLYFGSDEAAWIRETVSTSIAHIV
jgi:hypothetical protein